MVQEVDSATLQQWLHYDRALIIDVREPCEYEQYAIKGSINIPLSMLLVEIEQINPCEDRKIVMVCAVGVRSMRACQILKQEGYSCATYNLKGGLQSWLGAIDGRRN